MEKAKGKASTRAKNKYNSANYDNLRIVVPKGRKSAIEAHAKSKGESVNKLVNDLLRADMGLTEGQWKQQNDVLADEPINEVEEPAQPAEPTAEPKRKTRTLEELWALNASKRAESDDEHIPLPWE